MPYCTLVEFEWSDDFGRDEFNDFLSKIAGVDDNGARIIEGVAIRR